MTQRKTVETPGRRLHGFNPLKGSDNLRTPLAIVALVTSVWSGAAAAVESFSERGPDVADEVVPVPDTGRRSPPLIRLPSGFNRKDEAVQFSPPAPAVSEVPGDVICDPATNQTFGEQNNLAQVCYQKGPDGLYHRQLR